MAHGKRVLAVLGEGGMPHGKRDIAVLGELGKSILIVR
jgi:hypothetical protein